MPKSILTNATASIAVLGALLLGSTSSVLAQSHPARGGQVHIPESSLEYADEIGRTAHTSVRTFVPAGGMDTVAPPMIHELGHGVTHEGAPVGGYFFIETPASLGCVYNLVTSPVAGCNPYTANVNPSGGSRAIAIVDAYDYPTAASDLAHFSAQFGLPQANFQVVYASGSRPAPNSGWQIEEALDIEWAHAMAPNAKIYLVEAASNSLADLLTAVSVASRLVVAAGGGEVSMSWGSSEFNGETYYDRYFTTPGVVYLASAGDSPGVIWPSASPNVVSVGGTALSRNPNTGNFQAELAWQQTGGGPSAYEARPAYQNAIAVTTGAHRGTPDISAVA
ncbi:MAG TPA: hypothetical protein VET85_00575, partial [Stellaceae bacterium]|nr:hypothetical protein [Stellaceae bacterium]